MAYVLKHLGHDALAVSHKWNSPETIQMLCKWADKIIPMTTDFREYVPEDFRSKILDADVGIDKWANPLHPELMEACIAIAEHHGLASDGWRKSNKVGETVKSQPPQPEVGATK